jgi:hypothetical protein
MKTTPGCQRGNALIVAIIALIVLGGASAAVLSVCVYRSREAVMSHENARAFYSAEAGIGASMLEIMANRDYGSDGKGFASDTFDSGSFSATATDLGGDVWRIWSTGTYSHYSRAIEAVISKKVINPFEMAAFGGSGVSVGGTCMVDSYDSRVDTYANQVDGDHAGENGHIGSNGNIIASDDATVYGDAESGPTGSVTVTDNASISGGTSSAFDEQHLDPFVYTPVGSSEGQLNSSIELSSGTYRYSQIKLTSSDTVVLGKNEGDEVTIYVDGSIGMSANSSIVITSGTSVVMYHGSGKAEFTGTGLVNSSQIPASFLFFSATTDSVKFAGSSDFYGAAYCPTAPATIIGTSDFYGSIVGNTVTVAGTADIHYDEALADIQIISDFRYEANSWREFTP